MKKKYYLMALAALIGMVGILVYQQRSQTVLTDFSNANQISIEEIDEEDLTGISCYWGENKDKGVRLTRNKKDNRWEVSSYYSAFADEGRITRIVDQINEMNGELRSSSAQVLSEFRLEDKEAVHLVLSGKEEKELAHLLIGKRAPGYGESFVRFSGKNEVYLADKDYRYLIGLYNDNNQDPDPKDWADLQFVNIEETDVVSKLVLSENGRDQVIVVRTETENKVEEKDKTDQDEKKSGLTVKVISWDLVKPKRDKKPDKREVDAVIGAFKRLRATEIVDPEKARDLKAFGMEKPKYRLSIFLDGDDTIKLLLGNKDKNYYAMIEGGRLLYKINDRGFNQTAVKLAGLAREKKKPSPKPKPKPKKKKLISQDSGKKADKKATRKSKK